MYNVHSKIVCPPENICFMQISQDNYKTIHKAFEIHKLYQTTPIRDPPPP